MTLTDILTRVRIELGEPTAAYWTEAQLTNYINLAAKMFSSDTGILMAPPVKASVESGKAIYTLPADCPGAHAIILLYYNGEKLDQTSPTALWRGDSIPHSDTGSPTKWYALTDAGDPCFGLYPIPSAALVDGLVLWYWKLADVLTGSDVCEVPDEYISGVISKAAELAFVSKRDLEMASAERVVYDGEVERARSFMWSVMMAGNQDRDASRSNVRTIF